GAVPPRRRGARGAPGAGAALGRAPLVMLPRSPSLAQTCAEQSRQLPLSQARAPRVGRPLSTVSSSAGPGPLRGHSPATAALSLRGTGGRNSDNRRWALYSNLRFVASASLVALASLVGVLALFPDALEELVVASTETSDSPATACKQDWLHFDPSCLSRRGMPWAAPSSDSNAVPSTGEDVPARPVTESSPAATAPVAPVQQSEAAVPQQEPPVPAPVAEERQSPTQRSEAPQQETPAPPRVAEERQVPMQRSEAPQQQAPAPAPVAEEQHIAEPQSQASAPQQETSPPPAVVGERHIPKQRHHVMAPRRETPPVAEGRRAAKPAAEAQPRAAAAKKPAAEGPA